MDNFKWRSAVRRCAYIDMICSCLELHFVASLMMQLSLYSTLFASIVFTIKDMPFENALRWTIMGVFLCLEISLFLNVCAAGLFLLSTKLGANSEYAWKRTACAVWRNVNILVIIFGIMYYAIHRHYAVLSFELVSRGIILFVNYMFTRELEFVLTSPSTAAVV